MTGFRFFGLTSYLQAGLAAVFIGESAKTAWTANWPEELLHHAVAPRTTESGRQLDATLKLYPLAKSVRGDGPGRRVLGFDLSALYRECEKLGIQEAYFDLTFFRSRQEYKMACQRPSEDFLFGFGREHKFKPHFKSHPNLAGPLVCRRPGQKDGWNFEPVFLKAAAAFSEIEETWKFYPRWGENKVELVAELAPHDAPDLVKNWHPLQRKEVTSG